MKVKSIIVAGLFVLGCLQADAQAVNRTKNQHHRIKDGVKSGELTRAEAANLRKDQKEIRTEVKDAKADGLVTPVERKEIRQDKRKASREIYRKKHNNRDRN